MQRFRRKSDSKQSLPAARQGRDQLLATSSLGRSPTSPALSSLHNSPRSRLYPKSIPSSHSPPRIVGEAPTVGILSSLQPNDFRASVLISEFSQQFPVLRPGVQINIDDLKLRLADQRARGSENHITEEEEDMILGALRFRSRGSKETLSPDDRSLSSSSNLTPSPSSSRSKRYSNNLSWSMRLRDHRYMKNMSGRGKTSLASSTSLSVPSTVVGTIDSIADNSSLSSLRPMTPEGAASSVALSAQTGSPVSQQEAGSSTDSCVGHVQSSGYGAEESSETSASSVGMSTATSIECKLKTMNAAALKRASLALQAAIKELEDETEDEIVLPRSRTPHGVINDLSNPAMDDLSAGPIRPLSHQMQPASYPATEPGVAVAISTVGKQLPSGTEGCRASPLPSRTLPGYIPGMNRPMTPRDFDLNDRSHSITPRATSPVMNVFHPESLSASSPVSGTQLGSELGRKESISAATVKHSPRPSTPSPLFLRRTPSTGGHQTPEMQEGTRRSGGKKTIEFESPLGSSLLSRRRPISPLSNVAGSAPNSGNATVVGNATSSRPSTPSNVIWQLSPSGNTSTMRSIHMRSDSWISDAASSEIVVANGTPNRVQKNVQSPPPPDSSSGLNTSVSVSAARVVTPSPDRAQVNFSGTINDNRISDVFFSNRSQRSPTPTQNAPRSPSSPAFGFINGGSRRSSKQTTTSPWGYASTSYTPPIFNLFGNSSRTSVGSTGSSYHSWEGDKDDREWYDQILSGEDPQPMWHDLSVGKTDPPFPVDQAGEMFKKYFGLTVTDVTTIQEKLVTFAGTKGDVVRKRRPSTSQSIYVAPGRVCHPTDSVPVLLTPSMQANTPAPQVVQSVISSSNPTIASSSISEQYNQKASALLDSVVSDIQAKHSPLPSPLDTSSATVQRIPSSEPSPGTKRNHSLADVLFGSHDPRSTDSQLDEPEPAPDELAVDTTIGSNQDPVENDSSATMLTDMQTESQNATVFPTLSFAKNPQSPLQLSQSISSVHMLMSPKDKNEADFLRVFQEKIAQADATIKSASRTNLPVEDLSRSPSIPRKRIDTSKISSPQLLSHSNPASLETLQTIPSRSPTLSTSNPGNFSIGSRFKKFRGTLRAKNTLPFNNEVSVHSSVSPSSPAPSGVKTPSSSSWTEHDDSARFGTPEATVLTFTGTGRSKPSFPSSPTLASPGLKSFISRFRGKQRTVESSPASGKRLSSQLTTRPPPLIPRHQDMLNLRTPTTTEPALDPPVKPESAPVPSLVPIDLSSSPIHVASPSTGSRQSVMIQQLFDAANNLGLDQNALNDLLMRSGSITSRPTRLARTNTQKSRPASRQGQRDEVSGALEQSESGDSSKLTIQPLYPPNSRPSQPTPDQGSTRSLAVRPLEQMRRAQENRGDRAASTVIRRTIVLPDSIKGIKTDGQSLHRANSGKRRRGSVNSGSLRDRAPTPPPPRSPIYQRFSNDGLPPVPVLPHSLNTDAYFTPPAVRPNMNSMYDSSIYEMYANEGRMPGALSVDPHSTEGTSGHNESGPALEFIEYANGDTIWSIVSGLRSEEDEESIYNGRTSFSSEYSTGTQGDREWENVQVSVKEQARSNSRGSFSSSALKSRKQTAQSKSRPETKVFYSTSTQIGQLIENLSQRMDAGVFNFVPSPSRTGHSAQSSSSTNDISMEDRLELLLGSLSHNS